MNTQKKRQRQRLASVINLHRAYCEICGCAMKPGLESAQEISARVHRVCLQKKTHRELNASKCHDLWLEAYSVLCQTMPQTAIPLAREYINRLSMENYIDFVKRATLLVAKQPLSGQVKADLTGRLQKIASEMTRLMAEID